MREQQSKATHITHYRTPYGHPVLKIHIASQHIQTVYEALYLLNESQHRHHFFHSSIAAYFSPTCRSYLATADDRAPRATILQAESNNQLQFKINNNDSTNNNPRHTRSTGDKFNKQNKHQLSIRTLYQNINGVSATPREQIYTSKAANSNITIWPVHDKTRKKIVQRGRVQNIVATLTSPEDLAAAHIRFITKIAKAKHMTLQVGRRDDGLLDQAGRNEEPPD